MKKIDKNKSLQVDPKEMRRLGYKVIDMLVDHFENLSQRPVCNRTTRDEMEAKLRTVLPEAAISSDEIFAQLQDNILKNISYTDHPRFFAFVPGPNNFIGVLGDILASGFNVFSGTWAEASGPSEIEIIILDWFKEIFGFPKNAGGICVSGGSTANLTALAVARFVKLQNKIEKAVVYLSNQTHSSVERALMVLGFSQEQLRKIDADPIHGIDCTQLKRIIVNDRALGQIPFCLISNAGTTNTGAVDPLLELAEICAQENIWHHVDGAYAAVTLICPETKQLFKGLNRVDSLSFDPHKWLFQPYELGCVLVRDKTQLLQTFLIQPEYMRDVHGEKDEINFCDYGIQLSRGFRALKLWMSLQYFGAENFRAAIMHGIRNAEYAESQLKKSSCWEVITPAKLGVITFRFVHPKLTAKNVVHSMACVVELLMQDGFALVTSTKIHGEPVLRLCTINPRTTTDDIAQTLKMLEKFYLQVLK